MITMEDQLIGDLRAVLISLLADMQLVLVDLTVKRRNSDLAVEILVDHLAGGVTLDECSRLNAKLNAWLEENHPTAENYLLEVSSPGLDRPLKSTDDFQRVLNKPVRFLLSQPVAGKWEYVASVQRADATEVIVSAGAEIIAIPRQFISKAVQVIGN